jgi:hypothetical protein
MIVLLAGVTFGIIEGPVHGWASPLIVGSFAAAAAALVALLIVESRRAEPLLDPRFFASVPFSAATLIAVAAFAALAGLLFLNALYLQDVRGLSPLYAGLLTLPMAAMAVLLPPVSGRIVATRGTRLPLVVGGVGIAASGVLLLALDVDTPLPLVVAAYVLFGIGFGMINAPITHTAVSGMPVAQAGVAAGVASTSRQVGSALGVAVLGSLVTAQLGTSLATGFAAAARPAWVVVIGCGLVVTALGLASTTPWARETARRTADRFAVGAGTAGALTGLVVPDRGATGRRPRRCSGPPPSDACATGAPPFRRGRAPRRARPPAGPGPGATPAPRAPGRGSGPAPAPGRRRAPRPRRPAAPAGPG